MSYLDIPPGARTEEESIRAEERRRFAMWLLQESAAVVQNNFGLRRDVPTPRYLITEQRVNSTPVWAFEVESFEEAAAVIDTSTTEDVSVYNVYDLDTGFVYEPDRRTVGFNFIDTVRGMAVPERDLQRIDITPRRLSVLQPGLPVSHAIVTLSGGVAEVAELEGAVEVTILDFDDLRDRVAGHLTGLRLDAAGRDYLLRTDPRFLSELVPLLARTEKEGTE